MAKIQLLGKAPLSSCLRPLLPFQDTRGPVPDPVVRSGHLWPCLACSLPWSSHRASASRWMLGTRLAEATPKSLYSFLSPVVLWGARKATEPWQAGSRCSRAAPRPACHVCQLVLGPAASLEILFLETGAALALPRQLPQQGQVLPSAQHLQLSLRLFPSGSPGALPWKQRDPGASDVPAGARGVFSARERMPGLCSWAGRAPAGRKNCGSVPAAGSREPGCVSGVFWRRGRDAGAVARIPHLRRAVCPAPAVSCSGHCAHLHPRPTRSSVAPRSLAPVRELQPVSDSCFHPAMLLAACPVSWLPHRDYLLSGSPFPPLFAVGKKPGGRSGSAWGGCGRRRLFHGWVRTWLFLPTPASGDAPHDTGCSEPQGQVLPAV